MRLHGIVHNGKKRDEKRRNELGRGVYGVFLVKVEFFSTILIYR
jgi:hypothetical protein